MAENPAWEGDGTKPRKFGQTPISRGVASALIFPVSDDTLLRLLWGCTEAAKRDRL